MTEFTWCLPVTCPMCFKNVQHIRFEAEGMCTLWCGCRVSVEDWEDAYRPKIRNVTKGNAMPGCPWCGTPHEAGKGCAA